MSKLNPEEILKEIPFYKHKIDTQVQFRDVDSFGVVHNIQYFYYLEWARIKYMEFIGMPLNHRTFTAETPIMTVHHELDYFAPALFTDTLQLYSRVVEMRNSSMTFENIILKDDNQLIAKARVILVYLSNEDYKPTRIPDYFRDAVKALEGEQVNIIEK